MKNQKKKGAESTLPKQIVKEISARRAKKK
jgi:hypothetical protein